MSRDGEPLKRYRFSFELDAEEADALGSALTDMVVRPLEAAIAADVSEAEREWLKCHSAWLETITRAVLDSIEACETS